MYTEIMNPYSRNLFRRLNQILSTPSVFGSPLLEHEWPFGSLSSGELMTNVREDDDAFYVEMEVPGVKPDDIDLSFIGNELTLKITRLCPERGGERALLAP
jgi:HSP20 family molecular chaperone IbpA